MLNTKFPSFLNVMSLKLSDLLIDLFVIVIEVAFGSVPKIMSLPRAAFVASSPADNVNVNSSVSSHGRSCNSFVTVKLPSPGRTICVGAYTFVNVRLSLPSSEALTAVNVPSLLSVTLIVIIRSTVSGRIPEGNPRVSSFTANL